MRTRWLLPFIASVCFSACVSSPAQSSPEFPDRYDAEIERAAGRWLPTMPWRLLKSQYWQESLLDPSAVSHAGARVIAQFMPATWREVSAAMGWGLVSPHDVRYAVEAGAFYDARLRRQWRAERPEEVGRAHV